MLPHLLSESTVDLLARVVLHFLWQGTLLGLAAACLLHVSPIRTPRMRYAFFCGLLALLAICPLVTWQRMDVGSTTAVESQRDWGGVTAERSGIEAADGSSVDSNAIQPIAADSNSERSRARPAASQPFGDTSSLERQRGAIVTAWLTGIGLMSGRLVLGMIGVHMLARRRKPLPLEVARMAERLSRQLAFRVRPAVHEVERISQAMAVGIFKPLVLVPASWITALPSEVLEAVIAHELAHLCRWDLAINFLQRVVETLLFFHPAVWWCSRRLRIEREMCCDELAQAAIGNRVAYAKALAYLAHRQGSALESLLAAGIGGKRMVLLDRICNVLGMVPGRHGRLYGPSCALVGAAVASLAWTAASGVPEAWRPGRSDVDGSAAVARAERTAPRTADASARPADATEHDTLLDGVTRAAEPLTLENLKLTGYRDLGLEEAVKQAMANSKVVRSLGASAAHARVGASLVDFEIGVLNLLNDTEDAYWELAFAWRNLETANTALNSARQTWQKVFALYRSGGKGGEANAEGQAREQFYQFKSQAQMLVNELVRAESRLRFVMGLSPSDGELIRPIEKPTVTKVSFDSQAVTAEALARNPDVRLRKWRVRQKELQIAAAETHVRPLLNGRPADDSSPAGTSEAEDELEVIRSAIQWTVPLGLRRELASLRDAQLKLARERAKLEEQEREISHRIADAMRQLELTYQLTQTNFNRALAADRQAEAARVAFEGETVTIDQLLEAQRRQAEAQTSYYRTLLDYQRAILAVRIRRGAVL